MGNLMKEAAEEDKRFLLKNCGSSKSRDSSLQSDDLHNLEDENDFNSTSSTLKENSNIEDSIVKTSEESHLLKSSEDLENVNSAAEDESLSALNTEDESEDESDEEFDPAGYNGLRKSMATGRQSMAPGRQSMAGKEKTRRKT